MRKPETVLCYVTLKVVDGEVLPERTRKTIESKFQRMGFDVRGSSPCHVTLEGPTTVFEKRFQTRVRPTRKAGYQIEGCYRLPKDQDPFVENLIVSGQVVLSWGWPDPPQSFV